MEKIQITTTNLVAKLKENRKKHEAEYEKLNKAYREAIVDSMSSKLRAIKEGKDINLIFSIPRPENHVEDYDLAITMLEYETREEIEIERNEFEQYILDKWGWECGFNATKTFYANNNW